MDCAAKLAAPSTSVTLSRPLALSAAFASLRFAMLVPVITAASLVPTILTVTARLTTAPALSVTLT